MILQNYHNLLRNSQAGSSKWNRMSRSAEKLPQFENRQNVQLTCHTRLRRPTERQRYPHHFPNSPPDFTSSSMDFHSLFQRGQQLDDDCATRCVCACSICVFWKPQLWDSTSTPPPPPSHSLEFWIEIGSKQLFFIHTLLWLTSKQRYVHMYIGSMNFVAKSEKFYETEIKKKESKSMQTKIPLYIIWTGNMAILSIKNSKLINTYSN